MPDVIPISRASVADLRKTVTDGQPLAAMEKLPVFIPGTSLKGAWRSYLERTLRSLDPPDRPRICDPLEEDDDFNDTSCSRVLTLRKQAKKLFVPYSASCPVCRLFGSTLQGSRIAIGDGERDEKRRGQMVQREHTRIDRRSGRVTGAPLKFFGLQGTHFKTSFKLND